MGADPELLAELRQEAIRSSQADPPEQALTRTGQMLSALLMVAPRQELLEQSMVDAVNNLTTMMVDYIEHFGWHLRAVKTADGWVYEQISSSS